MWTRLVLKRWWARAFASAGGCAILVAAAWSARWLADDLYRPVLSTLEVHVASVVIFGLLVAAFTTNSHKAYTESFASLVPAQRAAAVDASFRGPVPADAPVRDAAIEVTGRRLYSARFWRTMWLVVLGWHVFFLLALFGTSRWPRLDTDGWVWVAVILYTTVTAWYVSLSAKHRLRRLRQAYLMAIAAKP
jgi:hypothetical protein